MAIVSTSSHLAQHVSHWVLLYVGPDLLLPLTSALAAIAGVLLMFWNRVRTIVATAWRAIFGGSKEPRG